jgi:release factor glutamine methyltransferase
MDSIDEVRKRIISVLQIAGIDRFESEREADLIVEHTTGLSKSRQFTSGDQKVSSEALAAIDRILAERRRRFPLQYLLGEQWFRGLRFSVTPDVLIPRADTETLVQVAFDFLRERTNPTLIDIGTGSGCIAISLLKELPAARALALDISANALAVARENAQRLGVADRIELLHCSWNEYDSPRTVDAIVCNPPYIPLSHESELQPEVGVFEPKQALFGADADGLGFYRELNASAGRRLLEGGLLAVEVGIDQAAAVAALFDSNGWKNVRAHDDLNGIARCISAIHAAQPIGRQG